MTLNNSEASNVNTLALWMLPLEDDWRQPSEVEARVALAELMDSAHAKLSAGMTASELLDRWALSEENPDLAPAHGPGCKALHGTHSSRHPGQERWLCTPSCPRRKWEDEQQARRIQTADPATIAKQMADEALGRNHTETTKENEVHSGTPCPECGSKSTQKMGDDSVYCSNCAKVHKIPAAGVFPRRSRNRKSA